MIDKYKTRKDCPDRTISPNCHSTCEGYLDRKRKQEKIKANRQKYSEYDSYMFDKVSVVNSAFKKHKKNKKRYR